jgi:hypothetical protein
MHLKYLIAVFLTAILLESCVSIQYLVYFKQGEITTMSLGQYIINGQQSRLTVEFPAKYNNQLKNIDYIGGWVKIGNELFTFNKDEIKITVKTAKQCQQVKGKCDII